MRFENTICSTFRKDKVEEYKLFSVPVNLLKVILKQFTTAYGNKGCTPVVISNRCFIPINVSRIGNLLGFTEKQVKSNLWFLEGKTRNSITSDNKIFLRSFFSLPKKTLYISVEVDNILELLAETALGKKYSNFLRENKLMIENYKQYCKENDMLFDENEILNIVDEKKKSLDKIDDEAKKIVNDILRNHRDLFSTKIPKECKPVTTSYLQCVRCVRDIYNGGFINPRLYDVEEYDPENRSSINTNGWRNEVKKCVGDWDKTRELIENAIQNFITIHDESYLPYNKEYLQRSLNLWFYDKYSPSKNKGCISQFVWCVCEPQTTFEKHSQLKAEHIKKQIGEKTVVVAEKFLKLNSNIPQGYFWENIYNIRQWAIALKNCDNNYNHFFNSSSELLEKFYKFMREEKIIPIGVSFDIERNVKNGGAWFKFITRATSKHDFNYLLPTCKDSNSIYRIYKRKDLIKK